MTEPDRIERKFCQRKMTDFVRITVLVIAFAVIVIAQNINGLTALHNERL